MITVANTTHSAARVEFAFDHKRINIDELCDPEKILHIDSTVLKKAEQEDEPLQLGLTMAESDEDLEETNGVDGTTGNRPEKKLSKKEEAGRKRA
jgi:type III restriction enzyme